MGSCSAIELGDELGDELDGGGEELEGGGDELAGTVGVTPLGSTDADGECVGADQYDL